MVTSHAMGNKPASIHGGVGSGSGRAERFGGRKRDASLKGPSRSRTDWSGSLSARWATNFNARAGNPPLRALCLVALREPGVRRAPLKMPIALVDFGVPVISQRDGLHFLLSRPGIASVKESISARSWMSTSRGSYPLWNTFWPNGEMQGIVRPSNTVVPK